MPARNALASLRLNYRPLAKPNHMHISLEVWSHSYDHPDPAHRNALVIAVTLVQPPVIEELTNLKITDRYGVDQTQLWRVASGGMIEFFGYSEWDAADTCAPAVFGVVWGSWTGIYDERCQADLACDSRRLQTHLTGPTNLQLIAFDYVAGPMTFAFDIVAAAPPKTFKLKMGLVGGNGGNPAQRWAALPDEEFTIQVP